MQALNALSGYFANEDVK